MMPARLTKSLIRIKEGDDLVWYHASPDGNQLHLRRIPGPLEGKWVVERKALPDSIEQEAQYTFSEIKDKTGIPANQFSVEAPEAWSLIARLLERPGKAKRLVPITGLRKLYTSLRDSRRSLGKVKANEFDLALAAGFAARPSGLAHLCNSSFSHFQKYDPGSLPFLDGHRNPIIETEVTDPLESTFALVGTIQAMHPTGDKIQITGCPDLSFTYVERELNALRTQNGVFETGELASSSGTGGTDLLLRSTDGLAIIGEVKLGNDTNAFFGLIQALTYAVEFATHKQLERLKNSFPEFHDLPVPSRVDVYLILGRCENQGVPEDLLNYTKEIAHRLCTDGQVQFLRRIACLEVKEKEGHREVREVEFTPVFAF